MKTCKQCGRTLPLESFRPYVPRGRGVYSTTTGRNTICKDCESLSSRAASALRRGDTEAIEKLTRYYKVLQERGYEPVTAPAKRLLGIVVKPGSRSNLDNAIQAMLGDSDVQLHYKKVQERSYASFDEADRVHKELTERLKQAGLYEVVNDLMDDWYMED